MTGRCAPSLCWLVARLSFIAAALPGACGWRASAKGGAPLPPVLAASAHPESTASAAHGRHWAPLTPTGAASTTVGPASEKLRASFLAVRKELQTRLLHKRSMMHSQMVIHESEWEVGSVNTRSYINLGLSVFAGLFIVCVLMKLGIFVD
mmetsp:Transcript_94201/g.275515  ORF Transcript_94201/g.275515 Transcript_94201/m.275515 type:complete len:150 (-) Transcript_94201:46-495(-)